MDFNVTKTPVRDVWLMEIKRIVVKCAVLKCVPKKKAIYIPFVSTVKNFPAVD
jgi:hypothetical protein